MAGTANGSTSLSKKAGSLVCSLASCAIRGTSEPNMVSWDSFVASSIRWISCCYHIKNVLSRILKHTLG